MKQPHRLNKFATAAMIPLVAVGFFVALRAMETEAAPEFVPEGELILANLRDESLTFYDFVAGTSLDVELAGPPHEMVRVGNSLFVTLGRTDAIAQVDIPSRAVERYLVQDGRPHGIASDGERLYVSLDDEDAVVVLDIDTFAELSRIETGATPHAIALLGATLFVANTRDGTLGATSSAGDVTRESGQLPESLALLGTAAVAVANAGDGTVGLFALPGLEQAALYVVEGRPVRVVPYRDQLLVARSRFGGIVVLDPAGGGLRASVAIGRLTDGMCVSPSGEWVAASANGDNQLKIVSTAEWAVSMEYATANGPGACLWYGAD